MPRIGLLFHNEDTDKYHLLVSKENASHGELQDEEQLDRLGKAISDTIQRGGVCWGNLGEYLEYVGFDLVVKNATPPFLVAIPPVTLGFENKTAKMHRSRQVLFGRHSNHNGD